MRERRRRKKEGREREERKKEEKLEGSRKNKIIKEKREGECKHINKINHKRILNKDLQSILSKDYNSLNKSIRSTNCPNDILRE